MNLLLTKRGRWMLAVGLLYCLVGAITREPLLILLGQIPIVVLLAAIFLYLPGAMVLDRRWIQLRLHPEGIPDSPHTATSTHVVSDRINVVLEITNHTSTKIHDLRATPFMSPDLTVDADDLQTSRITVSPKSRVKTPLSLHATKAGRLAVQGFDVSIRDPLGLIECIDYLPANYVFECYPAVGRMRRKHSPQKLNNQNDRNSGRPNRKRAPSGTDVSELRDYRPGEPLKNIAWKASARTRKLVARDFDGQSECKFYTILDISGSMRTNHHHAAATNKLDLAIQYAADVAQSYTQNRQTFGLITFDERPYAHFPPGTGNLHLKRVLNHLTALNNIAEPERTELDERELESLLADYLLVQERLDFRVQQNGKKVVNSQLLDRWLQNTLPKELPKLSPTSLTDALIDPSALTPTRRFLQLRGVPVPARGEIRHGLKERSLSDALDLVMQSSRQRLHIVIVTDLLGIVNLDLLTRTVKTVKAKGHFLEFLIPNLSEPANTSELTHSERYAIIHELFSATETQDRQKILQHLRSLAVNIRTL